MTDEARTPVATYDVPLRPDLIIRMTLPVYLTEADADRLAAFFRGLVFPEPAAPSPNPRPETS